MRKGNCQDLRGNVQTKQIKIKINPQKSTVMSMNYLIVAALNNTTLYLKYISPGCNLHQISHQIMISF